MKTVSILIAGVGGQGTLLASRILGALAGALGCDAKVSEVHGMAQRGGSVVTYVRLGDRIDSPLIEAGGADYLLAFELMEAVRYAHMVRPGGIVIVNIQRIAPMPVITGIAEYPGDLLERLKGKDMKIVPVDALALAAEAGSPRAVNTALMGALAREMDISPAVMSGIIGETVPAKTIAVNEKAFDLGYHTQPE